MNDMQLYRLLQQHVGIVNQLVIKLYKGEIEGPAAKEQALEQLKKTMTGIEAEK